MAYLIAIVRTESRLNKERLLGNGYYEYFQYDDGSYGSGYPVFSDFYGATYFASLNQAKEVYERNKDYLYHYYGPSAYDWNSVVIRKINFIDYPLNDI